MLDLRPIIIELGDQVAVIGRVAERLPESAGKITIVDEGQLETAQTITRILRAVADWMWLVALAVAASQSGWPAGGADRAARARDRRARRRAPDARRAPRRGRLSRRPLAKDDSVKPAVADAWSILTQVLVDRAWVWIILGVVTLVGVWFVGELVAPARRAAPRSPSWRTA